jgi:endonuclease YncB( thermonuclease family)
MKCNLLNNQSSRLDQNASPMKNCLRVHWFLAFLFVAILAPSLCSAWSGKVVSVSSGDTINVLHKGKVEKVRLYGIYAPQKKQSFEKKARDFASSFVNGENVEVEQKGADKNGRTIGLVSVSGEAINELMVINGYAWVHRQYCKEKFCTDWIKMEDAARQGKKGMWSDPNLILPKELQSPKGK